MLYMLSIMLLYYKYDLVDLVPGLQLRNNVLASYICALLDLLALIKLRNFEKILCIIALKKS